MRNLLKIFAGLLVVAYIILFAWANRGTTYIYYWPAKGKIIPLLGYMAADESKSFGGATVPPGEVSPEHLDEALTGGEVAEARVPRPVPVFVPIMIAFLAGFGLCWMISTSLVVKEKNRARKLRRELRKLRDQLDALQKVEPPADLVLPGQVPAAVEPTATTA